MNDFLKNLRSGKEKQAPKKKYSHDSHRYHYEKQYRGNEKRAGSERRKFKDQSSQSQNMLTELLIELGPIIKKLLNVMAENQNRFIASEELRAKAEEQKAKAISDLADYLKSEGLEALINSKDTPKKKKRAKKPIDANRKKVMQIIAKMRAKGETFEKIALHLDKEKLRTFSGRGQWHAQTIHRLYQDHIIGG